MSEIIETNHIEDLELQPMRSKPTPHGIVELFLVVNDDSKYTNAVKNHKTGFIWYFTNYEAAEKCYYEDYK